MKLQRLVWLPLATLAIAWLSMQLPLQRQISQAVDDALLRSAAEPSDFARVLVLDFDDASLRSLQPQLGPWPYSREVHARLLQTLREAGAAAVVFDIVFADARDGDDRFAAALAERADTVLAVAARRDAATDNLLQPPPAIEPFSTLPAADTPLTAWPSVMLPTPVLLHALTHAGALGVISTPLDDDGQLRRLPLLHQVAGRVLPHLALAALLLDTDGLPALKLTQRKPGAGAVLTLGGQHWLLDSHGAVRLVLPANLDDVPWLAAASLLGPAASEGGAALRARIQGRHVFVGSSAFFGDVVQTPQGRLHGTAMVAGAYEALRGQSLLAPAGAWAQALLLLALTPVARVAWRGRPALRADAAAASGLALVITAVAWAAGRYGGIQLSPWMGLTCLMAGLVLTVLMQVRSAANTNRALRERQLAAEAANRAKSDFLAGVSHELRTPLHAVLGMADVLSQSRLAPEQQRYVEIFRTAGQTLVSLIDDLLDLSRIESGQLALDLRPFVLATLLDDVLLMLRPRAAAKGLTLEVRTTAEAPDVLDTAGLGDGVSGSGVSASEMSGIEMSGTAVSGLALSGHAVLGDARRLRQVLVNLVANAIKFHGCGVGHGAGRPRHTRLVAGARQRHRHRHQRSSAATHLSALRAGRRQHHPALRRHGARTVDQQRPGALDGRQPQRRKRARPWLYLRVRGTHAACERAAQI